MPANLLSYSYELDVEQGLGRCLAHPESVDDMKRCLYLTVIALGLFSITACIGSPPPKPVTEAEKAEVMAALQDRSFRSFHPSKDAPKRKGVILDFFGPVALWAQYAVGERAIDEWEIGSHEYSIEKHGDISEVTIHLEGAMARRNLPNECENCIPTAGVSISIRNLFDSDKIAFKVNDPNGILPSPFPIFESWTRFTEDEYQNGG